MLYGSQFIGAPGIPRSLSRCRTRVAVAAATHACDPPRATWRYSRSPFRRWFDSQSLDHGSPFRQLGLHLGLDLEGMVSDPLSASKFVQFLLKLHNSCVESEVVRQQAPALAFERADAQGLRGVDSCNISVLAKEFPPHCGIKGMIMSGHRSKSGVVAGGGLELCTHTSLCCLLTLVPRSVLPSCHNLGGAGRARKLRNEHNWRIPVPGKCWEGWSASRYIWIKML